MGSVRVVYRLGMRHVESVGNYEVGVNKTLDWEDYKRIERVSCFENFSSLNIIYTSIASPVLFWLSSSQVAIILSTSFPAHAYAPPPEGRV